MTNNLMAAGKKLYTGFIPYRAKVLALFITSLFLLAGYFFLQYKVSDLADSKQREVINQIDLAVVNAVSEARAVADTTAMILNTFSNTEPKKIESPISEVLRQRLSESPEIMQARWMDASGLERVKVVNTSLRPVIIAKEDLINKSSRDYHQQSVLLKPDQYYLSPLEANKEFGKVVHPVQYTMRLSKGLFKDEKISSYLILNIAFNNVMGAIYERISDNVKLYVRTDENGWIYTPSVGYMKQRGGAGLGQSAEDSDFMQQAELSSKMQTWLASSMPSPTFEQDAYVADHSVFNGSFFSKSFSTNLLAKTNAKFYIVLDSHLLLKETLQAEDTHKILTVFVFGWVMSMLPIIALQRYDHLRDKLIVDNASDESMSFRLQEPWMKMLFDSLQNGVILADQNGVILTVNQRARELVDIPKDQHPRTMRDDDSLKMLWFRLLSSEGEKTSIELRGKILLVSYQEITTKEHSYYMVNVLDNSLQKYFEDILQEQILRDQSTLLPNKVALEQDIKADLDAERKFALSLVNIQGINLVADSLGHHKADSGLLNITNTIQEALDESTVLYRMGGSEIALKIMETDRKKIKDVLEHISEICSKPLSIDGQDFFMTLQTGVSVCPDDSESRAGLIRQAYLALQSSRTKRGQHISFFDQSMEKKTKRQIKLEAEVRRGLSSEEFLVYLQPKIFMRNDNKIASFEALSRWRHPQRGILLPADFIDQVETGPMAVRFGYLAFKNTVMASKQLNERLKTEYRLAVNFSTHQLFDAELLHKLVKILEELECPSKWIGIEVTETSMMHDTDAAVRVLASLVDMGFEVAIDDFGTGYSSLSYLKKLPVQTIKVDRAFIRNIARDKDDRSIVEASVSMAHAIGMNVVAEGVEDQVTHRMLVDLGVDEGQGYLYAHPSSVDDTIHWAQRISDQGLDVYQENHQDKVVGFNKKS